MLVLDLFRFNTRLKVLAFAIGICVAFIVGSFAFANGLSSTVEKISDKFVNEGILVYEGDCLGDSLVNLSGLHIDQSYASVAICTASVDGSTRTFFAVKDPAGILLQDIRPDAGEILSGKVDVLSGQVNISSGLVTLYLHANHTYSSSVFPAYWHLMRWEDLSELRPEIGDSPSFMLFVSWNDGLIVSLQSEGLTVQKMTAILNYFNAGSAEVTNDLWLIVIPSSFIVALLVYFAVTMEVRDRAKEIAILKAMGGNNRQIGTIFLFQALVLSILGALVGIMLGVIISYAISTSSSVAITNSLFFLKVTESSMIIAFGCSTIAGIAGSITPIYLSVKQSVREAMR